MHTKSLLLAALTASIALAGLIPAGFGAVATSLAPTLPTEVPTAVPAGSNTPILPRHGEKNKQGGGNAKNATAAGGSQTQQGAAQASGAAANSNAAAGGAVGACNGTATAAGGAQQNAQGGQAKGGNNKRSWGKPIYPRHKGEQPLLSTSYVPAPVIVSLRHKPCICNLLSQHCLLSC